MNDGFTDFYHPHFDPANFACVADAPGVIVLYDGTQAIYLTATSSALYWLRAHWAERSNPVEDAELWEYVCFYLSDIRFAVKRCENPEELAAQLLPDLCPRFNLPALPRPNINNLAELGNEVLHARAKLSTSGFLLFCDLACYSLSNQEPRLTTLMRNCGADDLTTFGFLIQGVKTFLKEREEEGKN